MSAALFSSPFRRSGPGIATLIKEPDFLITDYFVVGGVGAAFLNAGVLTLLSIALIYFLDMEMDGHTITSACLMFGFSLFGKNLFNIWAIMLGIWLYAKYHKTHMSHYVYVGLYGTSLSPIITQLMHIGDLPGCSQVFPGSYGGNNDRISASASGGSGSPRPSGIFLVQRRLRRGIIATVIVSLLKSFGITVESRLIWYTGSDFLFFTILSILFLGMAAGAFYFGGRGVVEEYSKILHSSGHGGSDYLRDNGGPATVLNMAVNGFMATLLVLIAGGDLNGPTIGGIFTIVGFSSTGKHIRNIFPIMAGVYLAGLTKRWNISDPSPMLAFLFSTTLAPISGEFGWLAGLVAGFLHSSVALNVGIVYGGMNLYNNGFAGGMVAIFMVPVIQSVRDRRARAKEEEALE